MSFGVSGNKQISPFTVSATLPNNPPVTQGQSNFSFGSGLGFSFGGGSGPVPAPSAAPQLSFTAATPATNPGSLFNFGTAPVPAAATSVPAAAGPAPTAPSTVSFGFGSGSTASGVTTSAPTLPSFGQPTLSFGTSSALTTTTTPSLTTPAAPISFTNVPPATATSTAQTTFGLSSVPQTTSGPTLSLGATATTSASGFTFGGSTAPSLNLTTPIKPVTTTAATVGGTIAAATTSGTTPVTQLSTTTTTTQSSATNVSQMNFRQLQEAINKWMIDLQEQEKIFLEQATKVNAWDRTLIANGDKIAKLNESITKVKCDHQRLEHALDYLKLQQQEFENVLEPLESSLPINAPVEPEREHLYSLTENVDTQLQQMSEDLKEVIRHINEANKTVDKNDPISQILRILNEHTDALQWVEDNAKQVRQSLEDVSKQHQMAKKEHERSLRMMFK